jgi:hypothetical protein
MAFRWITLLWPSNGFGVEKIVSILDPLLAKLKEMLRTDAPGGILAGIVDLCWH